VERINRECSGKSQIGQKRLYRRFLRPKRFARVVSANSKKLARAISRQISKGIIAASRKFGDAKFG
jgi:hypothetical protein